MINRVSRRELSAAAGDPANSETLLPAAWTSPAVPQPSVARVVPVTGSLCGAALTDDYRWKEMPGKRRPYNVQFVGSGSIG